MQIPSFKSRIKRFGLLTLIMLVGWGVALQQATAQEKEPDVIYVPTPDTVVEKMMEMAGVGPGDYVVDLGSGDGRIVIAAAEHGAYAHGIEIDPKRLQEARRNAENAEVTDKVTFVKGDLFEADFSRANVVMMYLLRSLNLKLRPKIIKNMDPGTPVVSHSFDMGDWEPDQYVEVEGNEIYLWYVPADVDGIWTWELNGQTFEGSFRQKFQELGITMRATAPALSTRDVTLKGKRISFIAENENARYIYSGKVEGDTITGFVQVHKDGEKQVKRWKAER